MRDVIPDESPEIEPGVFERLGDCNGSEIESSMVKLVEEGRLRLTKGCKGAST